MRAGICSIQQTLAPEAAAIVKQAVALARRRGHAQVTPLHVASTMLASSNGLLKRAILQSHSYPLQCKALELCFNVALNRLPSSTSSPLLGHQFPYPTVSNALVAAFKRAQANQRRGSIENQQQPILAVKIELEQLIISILDDPSVSRVMREAGFSSPQIKAEIEQAVSLETCSQTPHPLIGQSKESGKSLVIGSSVTQSLPFSQFRVTRTKPFNRVRDEDVKGLLDAMVKKKKNTVIVGECLDSSEAIVRTVIQKFESGEDIPANLRFLQFINLPISSLRNLYRDDVEQKIMELRCLVKKYASRGVVFYLGDLKWVSDYWSNYGQQRRSYYCPVEHIIMEIKRLFSQVTESERLWLMGIATFQSYMKCKEGLPSLETLWDLHPLTVPVGSLSLSLSLDGDLETQCESKMSIERSTQTNAYSTLTKSNTIISNSSSLPLWFQRCKEECKTDTFDCREYINVTDLSKKWHAYSNSLNTHPQCLGKTLNFSSASPPSSSSNSLSEGNPWMYQTHLSWSGGFEPKQTPKEHQFWPKPELLSNPNSSPNSASSSEVEENLEGDMFKEFTAENLKILCDALEKRVPWQKEAIQEIARTILECRSRMAIAKGKSKHRDDKEETWLFFLGADNEGKGRIARELAKVVFGSQSNFSPISLSNFASTKADSTEESKKKRNRDEMGCSYVERFGEAVNENPHRVFFMEDVEQVDYHSRKGIKKAIESGKIPLPGGEKVSLKDAIVIFSSESFSSASRACSPPSSQKSAENVEKRHEEDSVEKDSSVSLDLNIAIDHYANEDEHLVGDTGILGSVDRQIIFKVQEL